MNKKEKEDKRKEKEVIVRWKQNTAIKGNYLEKLKSTTTRKIRILNVFNKHNFIYTLYCLF